MAASADFVLERTFEAPRKLVWQAWTDPELISNWYGPNVETIVHRMELQPGGRWLTEMKMGDTSHFQRADYTLVEEPDRLAWLHAICDQNEDIIANPMMPEWPRTLLCILDLYELNGQTIMRLSCSPHDATEIEQTCFDLQKDSFRKGWQMGMDKLEGMLERMRAQQS